jgi:hypothetical protein
MQENRHYNVLVANEQISTLQFSFAAEPLLIDAHRYVLLMQCAACVAARTRVATTARSRNDFTSSLARNVAVTDSAGRKYPREYAMRHSCYRITPLLPQ